MTNNDLYNTLLRILRKESKGLAVSPDAFTDLLKVENLTLFNEYYKVFEVNQHVTDAMRPFKMQLDLDDMVYDALRQANYFAIPTDYAHIMGAYKWQDQAAAWTTWSNGSFTGTTPFDTLTSSGRDITSLVNDGGEYAYAKSGYLTTVAGTTYQVRIKATDNAVSPASDSVYIAAYDGTYASHTAIGSAYPITAGVNNLEFTALTTSTFLYILTASPTVICDWDLEFDIYEDGTSLYPIDILTEEEWIFRQYDALTKASSTYPILKVSDGYFYVAPKAVANVLVYYLKKPTDPYYDYYTDANYNIQYLAASASYTLQTSEVYRDGTSSGTVTSATVELEWDDGEKIKILHRILAKMGVSMDEQLVAQYAISKENA